MAGVIATLTIRMTLGFSLLPARRKGLHLVSYVDSFNEKWPFCQSLFQQEAIDNPSIRAIVGVARRQCSFFKWMDS
jgi:hypothetical protein